jgi:hypothetical protein
LGCCTWSILSHHHRNTTGHSSREKKTDLPLKVHFTQLFQCTISQFTTNIHIIVSCSTLSLIAIKLVHKSLNVLHGKFLSMTEYGFLTHNGNIYNMWLKDFRAMWFNSR